MPDSREHLRHHPATKYSWSGSEMPRQCLWQHKQNIKAEEKQELLLKYNLLHRMYHWQLVDIRKLNLWVENAQTGPIKQTASTLCRNLIIVNILCIYAKYGPIIVLQQKSPGLESKLGSCCMFSCIHSFFLRIPGFPSQFKNMHYNKWSLVECMYGFLSGVELSKVYPDSHPLTSQGRKQWWQREQKSYNSRLNLKQTHQRKHKL